MFTGLIQAVGRVSSAADSAAGLRLAIRPEGWSHRPSRGDSIAVSGVCLTLVDVSADGDWAFDVVPETLDKTTLGALRPGSRINLEHAVTASTLMGGHFVQGHVDGVGSVTRIDRTDGWRLTITPPTELMPFMAPKGSITVDGVSLTIAELSPSTVTIALIPTTLALTTLGELHPGDRVNLEADMLAKTVVNYLRHFAPPALPAPAEHAAGGRRHD